MLTKTKRQAKHETIVNDEPRVFDDFPIGTVAHQGDVIFIAIEPMTGNPRRNLQLADGNTQGSRHILVGGELWDCDRNSVANAIRKACPNSQRVSDMCVGPVLRGPCEIQHPEHGDHIHTTGATIAVVYQRNLDAEERERRTLD